MSADLRVTTRLQGPVGILDVAGDVTDTAHGPLLEAYQDLTSHGVEKLLLVVQPKSFMNSAGIRVIMQIAFTAESHRQMLRVSGLSPHMVQIFSLVGLTNHLKMFSSVDDALKDWR